MKIIFPGGVVKDVKPTACNPVDEDGKIKCCLVFDPILTKSEAQRIKEAAEAEIQDMQSVDHADDISEKQMIVDGLNPLLP